MVLTRIKVINAFIADPRNIATELTYEGLLVDGVHDSETKPRVKRQDTSF
jgi:hypothetical protein